MLTKEVLFGFLRWGPGWFAKDLMNIIEHSKSRGQTGDRQHAGRTGGFLNGGKRSAFSCTCAVKEFVQRGQK